MNYLKLKEIIMGIDNRPSNILEYDEKGQPVKFKQSKCTCKIILNENIEEYTYVIENTSLAKILELIAENEDKKYPPKLGKLGRNMFFLKYIYPIYKIYLKENGFKLNEDDFEFANKW